MATVEPVASVNQPPMPIQSQRHLRPMMTSNLSISAALCTYNGARFVREQVRSICLQTRPPVEIVLSDDGSTDDCVAVARDAWQACHAERPGLDIRLQVLQNERALGVTRNFQQAVSACRAPLIALSDQDDVWDADRLEAMSRVFSARDDLLLLHSDARLIDEAGRDLHRSLFGALGVRASEISCIHEGLAFDVLLRRNLATGATIVFRRELLQRALPFPDEWLHDEWLAVIASITGGVDVLEQATIGYRQHAANQVGAPQGSVLRLVRKLWTARGDTHNRRAARARVLCDRLAAESSPAIAPLLRKANEKLSHESARAALPEGRLARVRPVLGELVRGRYARFGYGVRGAIRDLLEPV